MDNPVPPPEGGSKDVLQNAAAESARRIAWVQEKIADARYRPFPPPTVWAGRADLIRSAKEVFGLGDEIEAASLIDLAVTELFAGGGDAKHVSKRLMLMRISGIRQIILRAIRDGRKEATFKFEINPEDPKSVIRMPVKEKITEGTDMAAVGRLIEIEMFTARLEGLAEESGEGLTSAASNFRELDELAARSMAQQMRERKIEDLPAAAQLRIVQAVTETIDRAAGRAPVRMIESRVVEPAPKGRKTKKERE
jgi:hypothetical protein